jgi:phage-related protein
MEVGYYPQWTSGFVQDFLQSLAERKDSLKAEAKIRIDIFTVAHHWPMTANVTVRHLKGYEPLLEIKREYDGIAYRIFFCFKERRIWLLHAIEKKQQKTPARDLEIAYRRMQEVLTGRLRVQS